MLNTFQAESIFRNFSIPVIRQMPPIHDEILALHMRTSMPRDLELELICDYLSHLSRNRIETAPEPYSIYKQEDRWWAMGSDGVVRYNHPRLYDVLHELSNNQLQNGVDFFNYRMNSELWINFESRLRAQDAEFEYNVQLREPLRGKTLRDVGDLSHNIVVNEYSFYGAERAAILSISDDIDAFRLIQVVSTEKLRRVYRERNAASITYGPGGKTAEDLERERRERERAERERRRERQEREAREAQTRQDEMIRRLRDQRSGNSDTLPPGNAMDDLLAKQPKKRRNLDL